MGYKFNIFTGTLDLVEAGATPGGGYGTVQFNDNGSFGGSSNFIWDNSNNFLRVKAKVGQSYALVDFRNSSNTTHAEISSSGYFNAKSRYYIDDYNSIEGDSGIGTMILCDDGIWRSLWIKNASIEIDTGALNSNVTDGATAIGFSFKTNNTFSTTGALIFKISNDTTSLLELDKDGNLAIQATDMLISGSNSNSAAIINKATTSTIPSLLPNKADTNTGIGSDTATSDNLSFIVGGSEAMEINSDGNIGIGTAATTSNRLKVLLYPVTASSSSAIYPYITIANSAYSSCSGLNNFAVISHSSGNLASAYGGRNTIVNQPSGTGTSSTIAALYNQAQQKSANALAYLKGEYLYLLINANSGNVSQAIALESYCSIYTGSSVTSFYGYKMNNPNVSGSLTNLYGIYFSDFTAATNNYTVYCAGTLDLHSGITDTASAVGFEFRTYQNLTTAGAKLVSIKNQNNEKAYIDKDGVMYIETSKRVACGGGSTGSNTTANGTVTLEINGTSYYLLTAASA